MAMQARTTTIVSPALSFPASPNNHSLRPSPQFKFQRLASSPSFLIPSRRSQWTHYRQPAVCAASAAPETPAAALRRILESPGIHQGPACFDALSAKLVERAGFGFCFMSGFSVSAARLGLPDVGLISYGEMVDQGYQITQSVSIPVVGDGDNGYGNQMNIKRTVKGFIKAGFAGIILEDQVSPKACGHTHGRKVVSREESVMRLKAAIDARKESGSDIVIIARTDSRQAISFEESLRRSRAFADAGADVLFIDALASREEMKAFCEISPLLPKMANMLEGGGKTPILTPIELEEIGFKIISYPLSLIGVSMRAMEDALIAIKGGRMPPPGSLPSFEEIKETLGFNEYYEEEKRYSVSAAQQDFRRGTQEPSEDGAERLYEPIVEVITPYEYEDASRGRVSGRLSRTLRIKITGRDGLEKLDIRIPAGFLDGISNIVPGLVGVNIKELLDNAADERGKILLDFNDSMGDRIQVFLEAPAFGSLSTLEVQYPFVIPTFDSSEQRNDVQSRWHRVIKKPSSTRSSSLTPFPSCQDSEGRILNFTAAITF